MIDRAYVQRMAHYNRWQNQNLYDVANRLGDAERRQERGAFFGSIHQTLSHLLWADHTWMSRFTDLPRPAAGIPESVTLFPDWEKLRAERAKFDHTMIAWSDTVDDTWLAVDQTFYSRATKREWARPRWVLVTHMFNHQTHHRGQVHCMLTQAGGRPSDTDLSLLPD